MAALNLKQGASSHSAYDLRDPNAEIIERRYPYLRPAIRENAKKIEEIAGKAIAEAIEATS